MVMINKTKQTVTNQMVDDVIECGDRLDTELIIMQTEGVEDLHIAAGALHTALSFTLGTAPSYDHAWELIEATIDFHRKSIEEELNESL